MPVFVFLTKNSFSQVSVPIVDGEGKLIVIAVVLEPRIIVVVPFTVVFVPTVCIAPRLFNTSLTSRTALLYSGSLDDPSIGVVIEMSARSVPV